MTQVRVPIKPGKHHVMQAYDDVMPALQRAGIPVIGVLGVLGVRYGKLTITSDGNDMLFTFEMTEDDLA